MRVVRIVAQCDLRSIPVKMQALKCFAVNLSVVLRVVFNNGNSIPNKSKSSQVMLAKLKRIAIPHPTEDFVGTHGFYHTSDRFRIENILAYKLILSSWYNERVTLYFCKVVTSRPFE